MTIKSIKKDLVLLKENMQHKIHTNYRVEHIEYLLCVNNTKESQNWAAAILKKLPGKERIRFTIAETQEYKKYHEFMVKGDLDSAAKILKPLPEFNRNVLIKEHSSSTTLLDYMLASRDHFRDWQGFQELIDEDEHDNLYLKDNGGALAIHHNFLKFYETEKELMHEYF